MDFKLLTSWNAIGRHRWVEYVEKGRYNASQVPPEWHGWLHNITDHTGDEASIRHFEIVLRLLDEVFYWNDFETLAASDAEAK